MKYLLEQRPGDFISFALGNAAVEVTGAVPVSLRRRSCCRRGRRRSGPWRR